MTDSQFLRNISQKTMKYSAKASINNSDRRFDRKLNRLGCSCRIPVPSGDYGSDKHGEYEECEICKKRIYEE